MKKLQAGQGLLSLIPRLHLACISLPVQCVLLKGIHIGVGLGSGAETGNENDKSIHLKHFTCSFSRVRSSPLACPPSPETQSPSPVLSRLYGSDSLS